MFSMIMKASFIGSRTIHRRSTKPVQVADDKTFDFGYIGFGSFDDTGKIDNIRVYAPKMEKKKTATWSADGSSVGWKTAISVAAIGIQSRTLTNLVPANQPTS